MTRPERTARGDRLSGNFMIALSKSRLISRDRLMRLLPDAGKDIDRLQTGLTAPSSMVTEVTERLVQAGELTRFQVSKLQQGYWQGLRIGPYAILYPIGRGGMGIVYLARDMRERANPRLVALKVLPPTRARQEPRSLTRFQREMSIGLALPRDSHLARTLDAGVADGVHYLAMEYVPGRTVKESVRQDGPFAIGSASRIFADVARGLAAAHEAGFVHRDLKPANVIVSPAGRGKLLDFGFALQIGEATPTDPAILGGPGHTVGTMDYLAPEQARHAGQVGPAADLYALGCSLYYAVSGSPPFPGGTSQDKIRWHRQELPPPITLINPTVPAEFDRLIAWIMAKRPTDRPASASKLAEVLERWADPATSREILPELDDASIIQIVEQRWLTERDSSAPGLPDTPVEENRSILEESTTATPDEPAEATALRLGMMLPFPRWLVILALLGLLSLAFVLGFLAASALP